MTTDLKNLPNVPLVSLDQPAQTVCVMKPQDYLLFQIAIILSDEHVWLAGVDLHHDPRNNRNELFEHWISSGAAERFSQHYKIVAGPDNFARNFGTPIFSTETRP